MINALENIRQSLELLEGSAQKRFTERQQAKELLKRAISETGDSIRVLKGGGLHPQAVAHLKKAKELAEEAACSVFSRRRLTEQAIEEQKNARKELVESSSSRS